MPQPNPIRSLARLRRRLLQAGVTQQRVADEAGVTKFHVSHVLSGRDVSARVIETAERLIEAAQRNGSAERLRA